MEAYSLVLRERVMVAVEEGVDICKDDLAESFWRDHPLDSQTCPAITRDKFDQIVALRMAANSRGFILDV